jgi:hypothetical protein
MDRRATLEDLTPKWREYCAPRLAGTADQVAAELAAQLPESLVNPTPDQLDRLAEAAQGKLRSAAGLLLQDCLQWLDTAGRGVGAEVHSAARERLEPALAGLPRSGRPW